MQGISPRPHSTDYTTGLTALSPKTQGNAESTPTKPQPDGADLIERAGAGLAGAWAGLELGGSVGQGVGEFAGAGIGMLAGGPAGAVAGAAVGSLLGSIGGSLGGAIEGSKLGEAALNSFLA